MLQSGNTADDSRFNPSLTLLGAMGVELIVKPSCLMEADPSDHSIATQFASPATPSRKTRLSPHYTFFQIQVSGAHFPVRREQDGNDHRQQKLRRMHPARVAFRASLLALAPFHRDPVLRCRRTFSAW